jgi:hypothetical protein
MNVYNGVSKRQLVLLCALIGRQSWSGGRKCYDVEPAYTSDNKRQVVAGKKVYVLTFDLGVWQQAHIKCGYLDGNGPTYVGQPPTLDHILGFIQGVLAGGGGSVAALEYKVLGMI